MQDVEKQYTPSLWSQRLNREELLQSHLEACHTGSVKARSKLTCRTISYGPSQRQAIDIYSSDQLENEADVIIYLHGGYWQTGELCRENCCFMAPPLVEEGIIVIVIGYDIAPTVTMPEILKQVHIGFSKAVEWAEERDSRGVYLMGHSAGAQLSAMILTSPISQLVKGAILLSGIYDLRPLVRTTVNDALKMTEGSAWQASPLQYIQSLRVNCMDMRILVASAQYDSPAFRQQSRHFYKELEKGVQSEYIQVTDVDHFNLIENLANPSDFLVKTIIKWVKKQ